MGNLLDLEFSNFTDLSVIYHVHVLVSPDTYLLPQVQFPISKSNQSSNISFRNYSSGNCFLLCNTRSTYEWSALYNVTVDAIVYRLVVAVTQAIETAVPTVHIKKCELSIWCFEYFKYYVKRKNYFYRNFKQCRSNYRHDRYSSYRKLVRATMKCDKLIWLKGIDYYLKTNPVHFWKCVFFQQKRERERERETKIPLNLRLTETVWASHVNLQRLLLHILRVPSPTAASATFLLILVINQFYAQTLVL